MVEWEDSAQPTPAWSFLANQAEPTGIRCLSVGWLIHDGTVKALAPNMGNVADESNAQVSGVIQIPARCIIRLIELDEP